jgi:hypothetical protein
MHMPGGSKFSLSGFRAFGLAGRAEPGEVEGVSVKRDASDGRHATVSWSASAADFYVVRYGLAGSANLFHNYQVYGATSTEIRALVIGVGYGFAVDAVSENGVALGKQIVTA